MLNQITDLIREHAGDSIINNAAIPNDKNDSTIEATGTGLMQALQSHAAQGGGGLQNVLNMFGGAGGSGASNGLIDQVANTVAGKVGISPAIAKTAVSAIIPMVMGKIAKRTSDPNDSSFTMDGLLSSLAGSGNPAGLGGAVSGALGGLFGK